MELEKSNMPSKKIIKKCENCEEFKLSFPDSRFCSLKCVKRDEVWVKRISRTLKAMHKGGQLKGTFKKGHKINIGRKVRNKGKTGVYSQETIEKIRQARLRQVIPNKDTSIEMKIQNLLKENSIPFSMHYPILGQPDIFIKPNICIFADGCYWHHCRDCGFGCGREKDEKINRELTQQGYKVIRLWEHQINTIKANDLINLIAT